MCYLDILNSDRIISTWLDDESELLIRERLIAGLPVNIRSVLKQFSGFIIFDIASSGGLCSSFDM